MSEGLLQGIRVIEFGHFVALPSATAILADWGADVIKIENPRGGDPVRFPGGVEDWEPPTDVSMGFEAFNRNKRSVALDVTTDRGREVLHKLVENADVFGTNFDPRAVDKVQADYETLQRLNPRLVYCQFTGYGTAGPERYRPGFDYAALWARSGMMDRVSAPDADPRSQRPAMGDNLVSPTVAGAIGSALYYREKTGRGQKIELNLYQLGVWGMSMDIEAALFTGKQIRQTDRQKAPNAIWNTYRAKDGKWLMLCMPQTDRYWPQFCQAVGRPEWENDPRFDTHAKRLQENQTLIPELDGIMATRTAAEWDSIAEEFDLIMGRVQTPLEVIEDPQAWENGFFTEIDHPSGRRMTLLSSPVKFSETPASIRTCGPQLGQHTEEILLEAGYAWDDLAEMKGQGVIL